MTDEEDDYLSDKFLANLEAKSSAPKTYAEKRKEAQKQAKLRDEQNRLKSRRQREVEAREEGLSKSLFERAKEEQEAGVGTSNKALSIMMKMGFKPGQSLGKSDENQDETVAASLPPPPSAPSEGKGKSESRERSEPIDSTELASFQVRHKVEPIPLNEWTGKKGIGLGKRAPSPSFEERVAKMAKMAEDASHESFRDRTRREYEERRCEGRLAPAQRTCLALDEKAGILFNVLTLNPNDRDSFPPGLLDALGDHALLVSQPSTHRGVHHVSHLREQMRADALRAMPSPLDDGTANGVDEKGPLEARDEYSPETVEEAAHFLRLGARDRLQVLLAYLRDKYSYCFWCGTLYDDPTDMEDHCPGPDEDEHD
ncbi:hypothetical protein SERLA73DRAFT_166301 [Serpula lacrymans var. lacrymans S7.3]|uniref:G-patch domain-containing protein n=1 Tax=Serpula lacrymans var. lacrymans (strain S7.3) TaxID=936435 RepID=F8PNQ7_SERL3|nr:hypothetical protein SERLA73DRAFT_166301 [Serpula lacrymans var. lacrymans S7.3]